MLLSGADFTLTEQGGGHIGTVVDVSGGAVSFANVPIGIYDLEQTKTPANHEANIQQPYTVTVVPTGPTTARVDWDPTLQIRGGRTEFVNAFSSPQSVSITLTNDDTDLPVAGVSYTIFETGGFYSATAVTNGSGTVTFGALMPGLDYRIERSSLIGYYPSASHTTTDLASAEPTHIDWLAFPGDATVTATAINTANGAALPGATYEILMNGVKVGEKTSGPDGELVFDNLPRAMTEMATFNTAPSGSAITTFTIQQIGNVQNFTPMSGSVTVTLPIGQMTATAGDLPNTPVPQNTGGGGGGGGGAPVVPPPIEPVVKPDEEEDEEDEKIENGPGTLPTVPEEGAVPIVPIEEFLQVLAIREEEGEGPPVGVAYCTPLEDHQIPLGYVQFERICPETGEIYYILESMVALGMMEFSDLAGRGMGAPRTGQAEQGFLWLLMMLSGAIMFFTGRRDKGKEKQTQEK